SGSGAGRLSAGTKSYGRALISNVSKFAPCLSLMPLHSAHSYRASGQTITFGCFYFQFSGWKKHATALRVRLLPTRHRHIPEQWGMARRMHTSIDPGAG